MVARPAHYNTRYKFDLSPRQREVLDLIARGRTNAEIAGTLGVSLDGAKYHVREILGKLDVDSREQAALYWRDYNRPAARLGRAFGSIFGLGALKAALGAGAIIGAGAAVAAFAVAINVSRGSDATGAGSAIDDDAVVTPVPTAPATPGPATPAAETPEKFAQRISEMVTAGRVPELLALSPAPLFACPGPTPQGAGGPFPLCDGAAPGEQRAGYVVARPASEASTIAPGAFSDAVTAAVAGELQLVSIGQGTGDTLIVAFATGAPDEALYLAFRTAPGASPQLTAMGLTNRDTSGAIMAGGEAVTVIGRATFEPIS